MVFSNSQNVFHKSASSPAIIRVPPSGQYGGQKLQQIKLQPSKGAQGGQPRIIKITRVGGNSNNPSAINLANLPGSGGLKLNPNGGLALNHSVPNNLAGKKIIITNGIAKTRPADITSSHVIQTQANIVRSTNSPVQFVSQAGLAGGKIFSNNSSAVSLLNLNKHVPQSIANSLPSMVHSPSMPNMAHTSSNSIIQNGDMSNIKSITQKDISRLWSNQDYNLKSVTQNISGMSRSMNQVKQ